MSEASEAPRAAFHFLGCRVNADETAALAARFAAAGYRIVPFGEPAEVQVLNTCTVTALADAEGRKLIRRAARCKPPGGVLVVTGCYAERDPATLRALAGVDLVLGNDAKGEIPAAVARLGADRRLAGELFGGTGRFLAHEAPPAGARTRATLKIQDGCNEACTYCIIPKVRGPSVSRPPAEVLREAERLAAFGYREIALTGVHTGAYGLDLEPPRRLAALVRALDRLGLPLRYRLNSLEPGSIDEDLLAAVAESRSFCRHFHVPLQHASDRILRRMGRGYRAADYARLVEGIAERFPEAGIGADVMAGFPGESEADFATLVAFVAALPLSYLHVFPWSPRPGTPALRLEGRVPEAARKERAAALRALDRKLRLRFQRRLAGRRALVLVEGKPGPGGGPWGLTDSYLRVELDAPAAENSFVEVEIRAPRTPGLSAARLLRAAPAPARAGAR